MECPWECRNTAKAVSWQLSWTSMVMPWHCHGTLPSDCRDTAVAVPWGCHVLPMDGTVGVHGRRRAKGKRVHWQVSKASKPTILRVVGGSKGRLCEGRDLH